VFPFKEDISTFASIDYHYCTVRRWFHIWLVIIALASEAFSGTTLQLCSGEREATSIIPGEPVSGCAVIPDNNFESLTIPIKRAGNLILIEALIDSITGNFVFDTGSQELVLNSTYFRQTGKGGRVAGGITGSVGTVTGARVKSIQVSELTWSDHYADITDLGHIENARGVRILGLFGLGMLTGLEVVIDLQSGVIELHRLDREGRRLCLPDKKPVPDLSLNFRMSRNIIVFGAHIADKRLTFCLDTGAETNVLHSALTDRVLSTVTITRRSTLRGAGQGTTEALYGVMNDFVLGETPINGMQAIITNLSVMSASYGFQLDGMLGCDFLDVGIFVLNLKNKELGICFYNTDKK